MKFKQMSGQAVAETLVCFLVLTALWFAVAWLARIQDLALDASIAARYVAFQASRQNKHTSYEAPNSSFIMQQQAQWQDQRGGMLASKFYQAPLITYTRGAPLQAKAQLGNNNSQATVLRDQWRAADTGLLSAFVTWEPKLHTHIFGTYPRIKRGLSIATGSAHSSSDNLTVSNLSGSGLGWAYPAENSYRLGAKVSSVASRLDSPWNRPLPVFDWLTPWEANVPNTFVKNN